MTSIYLEMFGEGQPIVLVHGWAMHSGIWREFAQQLALNYQVICVDLPGHGHSVALDSFTLERISAELVKAVPKQPCCWLGWSLGATVVLDIASRYPERVSALVLLAGNPLFVEATVGATVGATPTSRLDTSRDVGVAPTTSTTSQWPGMETRLLDDFARHLQHNCPATLLRFLSLQASDKTLLKTLKTAVVECAAPDQATLQGGLDILKQADMRAVLSGLNSPISVILGGLDTLVPVAAGQKMQALLPGLELNIIDRAGHVPFLSHSLETLAIISRFMEQQCS